MSESTFASRVEAPPSHWVWGLALLAGGTVATYGVILAVETLSRYFAGWLHARTLGGVLVMAFGFLGTLIPILLAIYRRRFLGLRRSQQWIVAVSLPGAHFLGLVAAALTAENTMTPVLPLPYTYTLTVHVQPDGIVSFSTSAPWPQEASGGGQSGGTTEDKALDYEFVAGLGEARQRIIKLTGTKTGRPGDVMEISGDLEVQGEKVRMRIDALTEVLITVNGQVISEPFEFQPGKYRLVISCR